MIFPVIFQIPAQLLRLSVEVVDGVQERGKSLGQTGIKKVQGAIKFRRRDFLVFLFRRV